LPRGGVLDLADRAHGPVALDGDADHAPGSAAEVAQRVFDAVAADQFYVFSHPKALGNVRSRMEAIVDVRNPPDPFLERPEVGEQLRKALREA